MCERESEKDSFFFSPFFFFFLLFSHFPFWIWVCTSIKHVWHYKISSRCKDNFVCRVEFFAGLTQPPLPPAVHFRSNISKNNNNKAKQSKGGVVVWCVVCSFDEGASKQGSEKTFNKQPRASALNLGVRRQPDTRKTHRNDGTSTPKHRARTRAHDSHKRGVCKKCTSA